MKNYILFCTMLIIGMILIYLSYQYNAWIWNSDMPEWVKFYFIFR